METTTSFNEFNLNSTLLNSLTAIGFDKASPIQELTIDPILQGKDIFAQAETGSGKTGSFAIPIIEQILRDQPVENSEQSTEEQDENQDNSTKITAQKNVEYVILSPTRELAQQTHKVFDTIGNQLGIYAACLIGGESIEKQKAFLQKGTRILVATPGRLVDLIKQKSVHLNQVKSVVFDEADRLFDMGFQKDIEFILKQVPTSRQLIMVSATSNLEVLKTAYKFKSHPLELKLNEDSLLVDNINHSLAMVSLQEKMPLLVNLLKRNEDVYAIVFCNTQLQTHLVAEWLRLMDFKAKPISGRLAQNKRTRLMEEFRQREVTILVCTDVAARGLDIKDVNLVINYDLPQEAANYVHRIGRTGRAGKSGQAISFCAHEDCKYLDDIYDYIESKITKMDLTDADVTAEIAPKPYIDGKTLLPTERKPRNDRNDRKDRKDRKTNRDDSRNSKKDHTPMNEKQFEAPKERAHPTKLARFVKSEVQNGDRRDFVITTTSEQDAKRAALGYYMINDETLLQSEVLKKGSKKFFFFGARSITYRFSIESHFKKLLLPFIIEVLKLSHINVMVKVGLRGDNLDISFNGPDEGLLLRNRAEYLKSMEQLARLYLANKITIPPKMRWNLKVRNQQRTNERSANTRPNSRQSNATRGPRGKFRGADDKQREEKIIKLAESAKDKVLSSKEAYTLKPLDPRDRRLVHQYFSEQDNFMTTSIGDGRLKKIEVTLK